MKCSLNSKKLECNASSGAVINTDAIKGDYCSIYGESGAQILVNDISKLYININSGCQLTYSEHSIIGNKTVRNNAELIKKAKINHLKNVLIVLSSEHFL